MTRGRTRESRFIGGLAFLGARQALSGIGTLFAAIVLVRHFGLADYGRLTLVLGIAGLFGILAGNYEEVARRYIPECRARQDRGGALLVVRSIALVRGISAAFATLIFFMCASPLSKLYADAGVEHSLLALACPTIVAAGLNAVAASILTGLQQYRIQTVLASIQAVGGVFVALIAAVFGLTMPLYLGAWVMLQVAIGATAATLAAFRVRTAFAVDGGNASERIRFARLIKYALPLWGSWISNVAYQHLGRSLLAVFAPPTIIGAFSLAKAACDQLAGLLTQLPVAMLPDLTRTAHSGTGLDRSAHVAHIAGFTTPLLGATITGVLAFAPEIFTLFAPVYATTAAALFALLCVQQPLRLTTSMWATLYFIDERTRMVLSLNMLRLALLVVVGAVLVPLLGARGAALAEVAAFMGGVLFVVATARRYLNTSAATILRQAIPLVVYIAGWAFLLNVLQPSVAWRGGIALACVVGLLHWSRGNLATLRRLLVGRAIEPATGHAGMG